MKVQIYVLRHPDTLEIRYIGRTKNELKTRLRGHMSKAICNKRKTKKDRWLLSLSKPPLIRKILEVEGWENSYAVEISIIDRFLNKGYNLVNLHDRGMGSLRSVSKSQKEKISKTVKRRWKEGRYKSLIKPCTVFDLSGEIVKSFDGYKEASLYLGISRKHLEAIIKRGDLRFKNFMVRAGEFTAPIEKYKNPRKYKEVTLIHEVSKEVIKFSKVTEAIRFLKTSPVKYYKAVNNDTSVKGYLILCPK